MCGDVLYKVHLPLTSIHKHQKSTVVNPFQPVLCTRCLYSLCAFPPRRSQGISVLLCEGTMSCLHSSSPWLSGGPKQQPKRYSDLIKCAIYLGRVTQGSVSFLQKQHGHVNNHYLITSVIETGGVLPPTLTMP